MKNHFAAIGECMIELSHESPKELRLGFGGDTLNMCVYFARCSDLNNISVDYITALGDDPYSRMMMEDWSKEKIGSEYVRLIPNKLPGLYFIRTDNTGERSFYYYRSNSAARNMFSGSEGKKLAARLSQFQVIYFSGITLAILDQEERNQFYFGLKEAKRKGAFIVFDDNYRPILWTHPEEARKTIVQFCEWVTVALPSYEDAQALFGDDSLRACADRYHKYGVEEVVVKHGKEGCFTSSREQKIHVPAPTVKNVVDTTAAGDSFNGAYLAYRIRGTTSLEAVKKGMDVAACVIQYPGAIIPKELMPKK